MGLTGLLFLAVYGLGLSLAFVRPVFGLFVYVFTFYAYPEGRWWGASLPGLRWSLIAAVVTLVAERLHTFLTAKPSGNAADASPQQCRSVWLTGGFMWLAAFAGWVWIQTPWAINITWHIDGGILFTKYVVLFYLLHRLLPDRRTVELFCWAHVAGCLSWGWIAWSSSVSGRMEMALGPGVEDANTGGLHLATGAAFAGLLLFGSRSKLRWLALLALPFILNAIILTASRGAVLGLLAAGAVALVTGPSRRRWLMVAGAAMGVCLFLTLAGSELFWERMATLRPEEGEEVEASAASRVAIASANWQMFVDYPLGVGHRGDILLSPDYIPAIYLSPDVNLRAAHNTMLAVLTNHGVPGTLLYVCLHLWAALAVWRMKKLDKLGLPSDLGAMRGAAAASIVAVVICGLFSNYVKAEIAIWCFALLAILQELCSQWQHSATEDSASTGHGAVKATASNALRPARDVPSWWPQPRPGALRYK